MEPNRSNAARGNATTRLLLLTLILIGIAATGVASAETEQEKLAKIAAETNNPVGKLWLLFVQNDLSIFKLDATVPARAPREARPRWRARQPFPG